MSHTTDYLTVMELPKPGSRKRSDERNVPHGHREAHTSNTGSRVILGERKLPTPEDTIMTDESYTSATYDHDISMSDGYYTNEAQAGDTTINRSTYGFVAPTAPAPAPAAAPKPRFAAPAPKPRFVPAPRRRKGILDPREAADNAAFFSRASRQYHHEIGEIVRQGAPRAQRDTSRDADKGKSTDIFWDGEQN
ncbi:hypothetical protein NHQ30_007019 [Ciborinia camelliae]|nr:hypothetical protein NHQ30_007019 [Ciborinia camelliae]